MNKEEQEAFYNELMKLYELTENVLNAIESKDAVQPELKTELVAPVIKKTGECADVLVNTFLSIVEDDRKPTKKEIREVESAIRKNFAAILTVTREVEKLPTN